MYDIVFISYHEPNAEENSNDLFERFNKVTMFGDRIKRVKNVKGIPTHMWKFQKLQTQVSLKIHGDAKIVDDFDFDYVTDEEDVVHVYLQYESS